MSGKFLLTLCFLLVSCVSFAASTVEKPEDIVLILQRSMQANNAEQALKHIDINSLLNNLFDASLPRINEGMAKGEVEFILPVAMLLGSINSGNMVARQAAITFLGAEAEKFVRFGVESGAFSGNIQPENTINRLDGGLFVRKEHLRSYRCAFASAELLEHRGNGAVVKTVLQIDNQRAFVPLELRLEERNGLWRIVDICNAPDLVAAMLGGADTR